MKVTFKSLRASNGRVNIELNMKEYEVLDSMLYEFYQTYEARGGFVETSLTRIAWDLRNKIYKAVKGRSLYQGSKRRDLMSDSE